MEDSRTDNFFEKVENYITGGISTFVAFLFFLVTIGALYGFFVASKKGDYQEWFLIAPAIAGLIAYYNRAFAIAVFGLLILLIFLF